MTPGFPKRVGVLTGGGDCPGLNAVLRAVTKGCLQAGAEVIGFEDGFQGVIENRHLQLDYNAVSGILDKGGTILGSSNKANPARYATGVDAEGRPRFENVTGLCLEHLEALGLEALVVLGGDGTMTCAAPFHEAGVGVIGVPKTIDNDVVGTELTFGFQTAVEVATEALDRVHSTAASHHRALVVETMGRNAGWLALHSGLASGSDVILLPEIPFDPDVVVEFVERRARYGKRYTVLAVSEGAHPAGGAPVVHKVDPTSPDPIRLGGIAAQVAARIEEQSGVEARHVVLGHVQRGGRPCPGDRVLSTQFGHAAVELLSAGRTGRMVALQEGRLTDVPLTHAAGRQRLVPGDHPLLAAARAVYTCLGDALPPELPSRA